MGAKIHFFPIKTNYSEGFLIIFSKKLFRYPYTHHGEVVVWLCTIAVLLYCCSQSVFIGVI